MLSASAYSFRQKSRLAISLSWVAGFTNIVALLACGTVVSHVTGASTNLGSALASRNGGLALFAGFLWLTFLGGAMTSAVLTESARRRGMASKYIQPIAVEAALLMLFSLSLHYYHDGNQLHLYRTIGVASFAMGLQNATITNISGAVVRTTHLTGVTTDLGLETIQFLFWCRDKFRRRQWSRAGRVLRVSQRHPTLLRVLLLASIFGSFLFGAGAGTLCYLHWHANALLLPLAFLLWIIIVDYRSPIADVREIDLMADSELRALGIVKSLLPNNLGIWRLSPRQHATWHKAPDFQHWVERIPRNWRVIILALSPLTRLNDNSILDLKGAIESLTRSGRRLVLSSITHAQYQLLIEENVERVLAVENICPDLEFAVARGIELVREISGGDRPIDLAEQIALANPPA